MTGHITQALDLERPLWRLCDVVEAVKGKTEGKATGDITSVSIDSREIEPSASPNRGALFVAIKGVHQDGHIFVEKAFANGALAAIVEKGFSAPSNARTLIRVDDTMVALNQLGRAGRSRSKAKIIAVTGSAGKTGTKEALKTLLSASGKTHASVKSFNNHWGVPITLARMQEDSEFGVFEVGMNHPGEITPLSQMIEPHIAVITTVAPVHIGHFKNEQEIARAKAEIFDGLDPEGAILLPADNEHFDFLRLQGESRSIRSIHSFGEAAGADCRLIRCVLFPDSSEVEADIFGQNVCYKLAIAGRHIVSNSLGVLGAVHLAGGDVSQAAGLLSVLEAPPGRGQKFVLQTEGGEIVLIDESYNANPASMSVALEAFGRLESCSDGDQAQSGHKPGRKLAILGDMLELGEGSIDYHRALREPITRAGVERVFTVGPHMKELFEYLPPDMQGACRSRCEDLLEIVRQELRPGDIVLVKGSLGSNMGFIVEGLKQHLPRVSEPL